MLKVTQLTRRDTLTRGVFRDTQLTRRDILTQAA